MEDLRLLWAMAAFGIALVLFFVEVFVPSGGILGLGATVAAIVGVVMLFWFDTTVGLAGMFVTLMCAPVMIILAMRILPTTPFARWLTLGDPVPEDSEDGSSTPPHNAGPYAELVGHTGRALTALRPVGMCLIDGRREECLAEGGLIEVGDPIYVSAAEGRTIRVRKGKPQAKRPD